MISARARCSVLILVLFGFVTWVPAASAQAVAPDALELRLDRADRIAAAPQLVRDVLQPPLWLRSGDRLVIWEPASLGGGTWVLVEAATGNRRPLVSPRSLQQQLSRLIGRPVEAVGQPAFRLSAGDDALLFPFGGARFRLPLAGGRLERLDEISGEAALLEGGVASPDGRLFAIQRGADVVVIDRSGRTVLTRTGSDQAGWRLAESPWSPDGGRLAVWREDVRSVHRLPLVGYESPLESVTMAPYAKSGTPLARQELVFIDVGRGPAAETVVAQPEGRAWLATWRAGGREALILHLSRDGKRLDLSAVAPATGETRLLIREERPETNVGDLDFIADDWATQVRAMPSGDLLWMSERDGWRHVYLYSANGDLLRRLTSGAFPVRQVEVAGEGEELLVVASANADDPYSEGGYRTDLHGGPLRALTTSAGARRLSLSPSGRYAVDSWSSPTQARRRDIVALADGRRVALSRADASAASAAGYRPSERVSVRAADGRTLLHAALDRPSDFDPRRRYPVVAYFYGGPFSRVLSGAFVGTSMTLSAKALAEMGFVVVSVDVRGSSGRSKAFSDATHARVGQTEVEDYVAALNQLGAERPWMDLQRVGVTGHSWGGYFAVRAMLTRPDVFKAGYAGAPGGLFEDASVNEPNMGLPSANPEGYRAGANEPLASRLGGRLKLMHGTADASAPLSSSMRMVRALIEAGKPFELLVMPGVDHNPSGAEERYYRRDVHRFFVDALGEPR